MIEEDIQKSVIEYCRRNHRDNFFVLGIPNEAIFKTSASVSTGFMFRLFNTLLTMGLRPGFPDLLFFNGGRVLAIELKTPAGKLSKKQEKLFPILEKFIGKVRIARSLDEVCAILTECGFIGDQISYP